MLAEGTCLFNTHGYFGNKVRKQTFASSGNKTVTGHKKRLHFLANKSNFYQRLENIKIKCIKNI